MPIYEFRCEACGEIFEHLAMKRGEELETKCPHCGGQELSRVMSTANTVMADPSPASATNSGPRVENRSCQGSGSCATITLPGHTTD